MGLEDRADCRQYGVGVPKGEVARSAAEAEKIAKEIGRDTSLMMRWVWVMTESLQVAMTWSSKHKFLLVDEGRAHLTMG